MRKRFWVGLITCLFAAFSVFPFVAISKQQCKQGVCAEAKVYGSSNLRAKARVTSTVSYDGRWTYSIKAGSKPKNHQSDQKTYRKGVMLKWEVSDHTANASAHASNQGKHRASGKTYYAHASESSGG